MELRPEELVNGSVVPIGPRDTLGDAWERMTSRHVDILPVVERDRAIGALLLDSVMDAIREEGLESLQRPVRDFMTSRIAFVSDDTAGLNVKPLIDSSMDCVIVQDALNRLKGIVSLRNVHPLRTGADGMPAERAPETVNDDVDQELWEKMVQLARLCPLTHDGSVAPRRPTA